MILSHHSQQSINQAPSKQTQSPAAFPQHSQLSHIHDDIDNNSQCRSCESSLLKRIKNHSTACEIYLSSRVKRLLPHSRLCPPLAKHDGQTFPRANDTSMSTETIQILSLTSSKLLLTASTSSSPSNSPPLHRRVLLQNLLATARKAWDADFEREWNDRDSAVDVRWEDVVEEGGDGKGVEEEFEQVVGGRDTAATGAGDEGSSRPRRSSQLQTEADVLLNDWLGDANFFTSQSSLGTFHDIELQPRHQAPRDVDDPDDDGDIFSMDMAEPDATPPPLSVVESVVQQPLMTESQQYRPEIATAAEPDTMPGMGEATVSPAPLTEANPLADSAVFPECEKMMEDLFNFEWRISI
ncbi:uncharacterized protein EV422DRAFT_519312 [Fimicolochytrium jonesii]|uniref:uncharacterized protein n=1 Tax=Fimicolochytrium jonesii TaxID=1396493 RepID=UPI0022FEEC07|nr:uncharacterized protein EV422DRAFT_519312 [Fimicolochytrium jonesii]KAI8824220.1 hypothetical protein EV422DRAFT_519312 [Fimicolochytrium jonesii]